jgi:hypothetical protein
MGGGDKAFLSATFGRSSDFLKAYGLDAAAWSDDQEWSDRLGQAISGNVGYVEGSIFHLAHGELEKKKYGNRYEGLQRFSFDPNNDIEVDQNKVWRWNSNKTAMHTYIWDYFVSRDEDNPISA